MPINLDNIDDELETDEQRILAHLKKNKDKAFYLQELADELNNVSRSYIGKVADRNDQIEHVNIDNQYNRTYITYSED